MWLSFEWILGNFRQPQTNCETLDFALVKAAHQYFQGERLESVFAAVRILDYTLIHGFDFACVVNTSTCIS